MRTAAWNYFNFILHPQRVGDGRLTLHHVNVSDGP